MSPLLTTMQNMQVLRMSSSTEALWLDLKRPIDFGSVNMGRVPKPEGTAWQRHRPGGTSLVVQWLRLCPSTAEDKSLIGEALTCHMTKKRKKKKKAQT